MKRGEGKEEEEEKEKGKGEERRGEARIGVQLGVRTGCGASSGSSRGCLGRLRRDASLVRRRCSGQPMGMNLRDARRRVSSQRVGLLDSQCAPRRSTDHVQPGASVARRPPLGSRSADRSAPRPRLNRRSSSSIEPRSPLEPSANGCCNFFSLSIHLSSSSSFRKREEKKERIILRVFYYSQGESLILDIPDLDSARFPSNVQEFEKRFFVFYKVCPRQLI